MAYGPIYLHWPPQDSRAEGFVDVHEARCSRISMLIMDGLTGKVQSENTLCEFCISGGQARGPGLRLAHGARQRRKGF